ncbi:MAG: flagellar biosynthesis protein FlhB [bacterium]
MADDKFDKTEPATPKRIQEARDKGQVMKSREVTAAFVFIVVIIYLYFNISHIGGIISKELVYFLSDFSNLNLNYITCVKIIYNLIYTVLYAVLPFVLIVFFASMVSSIAQVGLMLTFEPLIPDFNKINPVSGLKRFFSFQSVNELFKSVFKFFVLTMIAYFTCAPYLKKLFVLQYMSPSYDMFFTVKLIYKLFFNIILAMIMLAIADFFIQRRQYNKGLMMSKQEVKDEAKQFEGNPQIKSKIRKMQREIARRKILKEVKTAHVVITNPTHFAVALKYDNKKYNAPVVLAKGADNLAFLIKKIASENDIPTVENKYVARALYETCEPGQAIPASLYKAVAEILAHLYTTNKKFKEIWGFIK